MKLKTVLAGRTFRRRVMSLFCFLFLACLSYIILYPFISKLSSVFMSSADLKDPTVWLIPKSPTLDNLRNVLKYGDFWNSLLNTVIFSLSNALLQTFSATLVAYGLSHFRFKGKKLLIVLIVLTLLIPPQVLFGPMYTKFRFFDWFGILRGLGAADFELAGQLYSDAPAVRNQSGPEMRSVHPHYGAAVQFAAQRAVRGGEGGRRRGMENLFYHQSAAD